MPAYAFETLDVFTDQRFGGNPLAVFTDARGLTDAQMQSLAKEMNLSETTFVLPPEDPAHTARVRIFDTTAEMPFAGHPTIGTGWLLAQRGFAKDGDLTLEVPAGLVRVQATERGAVIAAPQPLSLGLQLSVEAVARCVGVAPSQILVGGHSPILASVGVGFLIAEVSPTALSQAVPDIGAFRQVLADTPELEGLLPIHLYARDGETLRTRMFAPIAGTYEDPATGSANAALAALLLSIGSGDEAAYDIIQGVEMGRPSRLAATARRTPDGVRSTIGGGCVPVLRGEAVL